MPKLLSIKDQITKIVTNPHPPKKQRTNYRVLAITKQLIHHLPDNVPEDVIANLQSIRSYLEERYDVYLEDQKDKANLYTTLYMRAKMFGKENAAYVTNILLRLPKACQHARAVVNARRSGDRDTARENLSDIHALALETVEILEELNKI